MTMLAPVKIDGFGTRRNASDTEVANSENRVKFVRMFASEAIAKGNAVCFDLNATEPEPGGYGNTVMKADVDANITKSIIGIAAEATPSGFPTGATGEEDVIIKVQVAGICDFATVVTGSAQPGDVLGANTGAGLLSIKADDNTLSAAIHILDGASGTSAADSTIFLLNPANL